MSVKNTIKKFMSIFLIINMLGCGISLILQSGLGSDAITLLNEGIHLKLGVNYTVAGLIYNGILLLLALLLNKKGLGLGSCVYVLLAGAFIDLYTYLLLNFNIGSLDIIIRNISFLMGHMLMCGGFAMLIKFDIGMSPLDAILIYIENNFKYSYKALKTIADILFLILGVFLGGNLGFGTLFSILCTGTTISIFSKLISTNKKIYFSNI
ncbi:YczE/YyaS/YitT family protein [Clostridioides difficile]